MGDEVAESRVITYRDFPLEVRDADWWQEFADRYGSRFSTLADKIDPADFWSKTFPDIIEMSKNRPPLHLEIDDE